VIASQLDHPVYDCFYLALAEARDALLVTADRRLLRKLRGTPWVERVVNLADYS
jgi:predicted nucleic acid-binding protein